MRVAVEPGRRRRTTLRPGQEVMLNEAFTSSRPAAFERVGEVVIAQGDSWTTDRALVVAHADEERVVHARRAAARAAACGSATP